MILLLYIVWSHVQDSVVRDKPLGNDTANPTMITAIQEGVS